MFDFVGEKLKKLAKIIFGLGLTIGIIYLFVSLVNFFGNLDCLEYASAYGGSSYSILNEKGNLAYMGMSGIGTSIALIISSVISPWIIYGFGIIVSSYENKPVEKINCVKDVGITEASGDIEEDLVGDEWKNTNN